jgi:hypothetical protein
MERLTHPSCLQWRGAVPDATRDGGWSSLRRWITVCYTQCELLHQARLTWGRDGPNYVARRIDCRLPFGGDVICLSVSAELRFGR